MASELVVCGVCCHLRGKVDLGDQRCDCEPHDGERWPGFDFNITFELCYCCGAELLHSGSRWSVWFCEPCKERVIALNRSAGRCLIPIGRHSLMAGVGLAGQDAQRREAVESFARATVTLFARMNAVHACHSAAVRANLNAVGLLGTGDVPLTTYLRAVAHLTIDRDVRVQQLLGRVDTH